MRAMVLSAGLGLRMRPLTHQMPKPAIPVLGRPILVQILTRLAHLGVTRAVVNVHHLAQAVEQLLDSATGLPETRISHEPVLLGTGGGLRQAAPLLRGAGPILVHNGDCLSDIDFEALADHHTRSGKLATLVLVAARPGYGTVEIGAEGEVLSLAGAPRVSPERVLSTRLFTGCHLIDEEVLVRIPPTGPRCMVADVYRPLAAAGRLGSFLHEGYWWEFGEPDVYLAGSLGLVDLDGASRARIADFDPVVELSEGRLALGQSVEIDGGARIVGRGAFGRGCHIETGATIADSVLMDGVRVGSGCRLSRVVVGPGTVLPAGFECHGSVICRDPGDTEPVSDTSRCGSNLVRTIR